jgi:uncharacterized protein HemY
MQLLQLLSKLRYATDETATLSILALAAVLLLALPAVLTLLKEMGMKRWLRRRQQPLQEQQQSGAGTTARGDGPWYWPTEEPLGGHSCK